MCICVCVCIFVYRTGQASFKATKGVMVTVTLDTTGALGHALLHSSIWWVGAGEEGGRGTGKEYTWGKMGGKEGFKGTSTGEVSDQP